MQTATDGKNKNKNFIKEKYNNSKQWGLPMKLEWFTLEFFSTSFSKDEFYCYKKAERVADFSRNARVEYGK